MSVLLRKAADKITQELVATDLGSKLQQRDELKLFIKYSVFISIIFVAILFNPMVSVFVALGSCVWILLGNDKAIQALTLFVFVRFVNPALVTYSIDLGAISWGLLIIAAIKNMPWGFTHAINANFSI